MSRPWKRSMTPSPIRPEKRQSIVETRARPFEIANEVGRWEMSANDPRRLPGSSERTDSQYGKRRPSKQQAQTAAYSVSLIASLRGQRRVHGPLKSPFGVPLRLTMANEVDLGRRGHAVGEAGRFCRNDFRSAAERAGICSMGTCPASG